MASKKDMEMNEAYKRMISILKEAELPKPAPTHGPGSHKYRKRKPRKLTPAQELQGNVDARRAVTETPKVDNIYSR